MCTALTEPLNLTGISDLGYAKDTRKIVTFNGPRLFCRTTSSLLGVVDVKLTKSIYKNESFGFLFFYKFPGEQSWSLFPNQVYGKKLYIDVLCIIEELCVEATNVTGGA